MNTRSLLYLTCATLFCYIIPQVALYGKEQKSQFLGPCIKIQGSYDFDRAGTTLSFQGGPKQVKDQGSVVFPIGQAETMGVKISAHHLMQRLKIDFHSPSFHHWIHQVGGEIGMKKVWEEEQDSLFVKGWNADLYFSHTGSKTFTHGKMVGSNGYGIKTAVDFQSKKLRTILSIGINGDRVHYAKTNNITKKKQGIGGDFSILHPISPAFDLKGAASLHTHFNHYSLELNWYAKKQSSLVLGLVGDYICGKHDLPKVSNCTIQCKYLLGPSQKTAQERRAPGQKCSTAKNYFKLWQHTPPNNQPLPLTIPKTR